MLSRNPLAGVCFTVLIFLPQHSNSSSSDPVSARSAGMAGIVTVTPGVWAGFHNQAALADLKRFSVGVHYENHFLIPENSIKALSAGIPVSTGTLGLNYALSGYEKFFEGRTGLAFGKSFGDRFSAGIQINHLMIRQPAGYGDMHALVPEGSILAKPIEGLVIGFHIFNPARQHFPQCHEQMIPSVMQIGLGYRFIEDVLVSVEVEKETRRKEVIRTGIEYAMNRNCTFRLGVSSAPISRFAIGFGYNTGRIGIDFAVSHHRWLGFSPCLTLTYCGGREQ